MTDIDLERTAPLLAHPEKKRLLAKAQNFTEHLSEEDENQTDRNSMRRDSL
jgi:hypothetical protein